MAPPALDISENPPASLVLERLLTALPADRVSLGWIHAQLREHSFEMLAFIMALIAILPGASVMIGVLMIVPAVGMMSSSGMELPSLLAKRSISTRQASFVLGRAIPILRHWESDERMRHETAFRMTRPFIGLASLLLGLTLLVPIPLSNVLPALAIAGLTLASFEESLSLLCLSAFAAVGSLLITGLTVLAASQVFANLAH